MSQESSIDDDNIAPSPSKSQIKKKPKRQVHMSMAPQHIVSTKLIGRPPSVDEEIDEESRFND